MAKDDVVEDLGGHQRPAMSGEVIGKKSGAQGEHIALAHH